ELPQAPVAALECDLRRGQRGRLEQEARLVRATGGGDGDRRRAEMVREEPAQLPFADPETARERGDVAVVQGPAFDQAQRARDGRRGSHPARRAGRGFWTATQARPEA